MRNLDRPTNCQQTIPTTVTLWSRRATRKKGNNTTPVGSVMEIVLIESRQFWGLQEKKKI
ncbi:CLUMA_CG018657, isoform A [Clunio marinus]|uniref:CLUMA_CG018657, isoform A n=1 Tax=Clunio marinus TaxID=568069 RepID=A0A1J1IZL8_9DIPT|nr:CLUMA_CG018657, isoform A [Clunio marinus]